MTHPIFVTGPQRAGSMLASHIIARDTNRVFVDEFDYNPNIPNNSVVQSPVLLKAVLELSFMFPTAKFAFMYRDKNDIIKSMERVQWYKDYIDHPDFYTTYVDHCYDFIDTIKQSLDNKRWFDIHYQSLKDDPLFITDRTDFTVKQYLPGKPDGPKTWRNDEYIRTIKK
tara:strand:- start:304 stop:810 length:507 start_codon:yes stop_codon:yes gene_type:complete